MACHEIKEVIPFVIVLYFLSNVNSEENICDRPTSVMYCSCDADDSNETETISCFMLGPITANDPIWDDFTQNVNTIKITFISRLDQEMKFVPTETIQSLEKLKIITLSNSKLGALESYTFSNLPSVTDLRLTDNGITELQNKCFYRMRKLDTIEMGENNIGIIPENAFVDLPNLSKLFLENNNINKLEIGAFQHLTNLSELDLRINAIGQLEPGAFRGLNNLHRLDLYKNRLEALDAGIFDSMHRLGELDLSNNAISKISMDSLKGLDQLFSLNLRHNRITQLPVGLFTRTPRLLVVDLSNNRLESVKSSSVEELKQRFAVQFIMYIQDNNLQCDCDLWFWIDEHLNKSESLAWRKQLRHIRCRTSESNGTNVRVAKLTPLEAGCSDVISVSSTTGEMFETPPVSTEDEMITSESSSQKGENSQKNALRDESQSNGESGFHMTEESASDPVKPDASVTKGTVEVQQSNYQGGSAHYLSAHFALITSAILLLGALPGVRI